MEESQSRATLKELSEMRTDIESLMPSAPSLKSGAWHLELFGGLTLGDALSLQVEILLEQVGSLKTIPELVTVGVVMVGKIDYSAHCYLSLQAIVQS